MEFVNNEGPGQPAQYVSAQVDECLHGRLLRNCIAGYCKCTGERQWYCLIVAVFDYAIKLFSFDITCHI